MYTYVLHFAKNFFRDRVVLAKTIMSLSAIEIL